MKSRKIDFFDPDSTLQESPEAEADSLTYGGANDRASEVRFLKAGASASTLANLLDMNLDITRSLLESCEPISRMKGAKIYPLKKALAHLISPELTVEQVMAAAGRDALPTKLQKAYYDALKAKADYEENQGELWRSSAVKDILRTIFSDIRNNIQSFPDNVEAKAGLSKKQMESLVELTDGLQQRLADSVTQVLRSTKPPKMLREDDSDDPPETESKGATAKPGKRSKAGKPK